MPRCAFAWPSVAANRTSRSPGHSSRKRGLALSRKKRGALGTGWFGVAATDALPEVAVPYVSKRPERLVSSAPRPFGEWLLPRDCSGLGERVAQASVSTPGGIYATCLENRLPDRQPPAGVCRPGARSRPCGWIGVTQEPVRAVSRRTRLNGSSRRFRAAVWRKPGEIKPFG